VRLGFGRRNFLAAFGRGCKTRNISALLATVTSSVLIAALPAVAQEATWLQNPGSGDFNIAADWNPAAMPTGTA
jgi:hypothetical protein